MAEWPILPRESLVHQARAILRSGGCGVLLTGPVGSGRATLLRLITNTRAAVLLRSGEPVAPALATLPIGRPALLGVEELDALTDAELDSIDAAVAAHDLRLVGTARSAGAAALLARRHRLHELSVLPIPPLSDDEAAELCRVRLGGPVEALTLRRILDLCDGWPLYLRDIVTANLRDGELQLCHGFWSADALILPAWLDHPDSPLLTTMPAQLQSVLTECAPAGGMLVSTARSRVGDAGLSKLFEAGLLRTVSRVGVPGVHLEPAPERRELLASLSAPPPTDELDVEAALIRADALSVADAMAGAERMRAEGLHRRSARLAAVGSLRLAAARSVAGLPHDAEAAASESAALLDLTRDPGLAAVALAVVALARGWRGDRTGATARREEALRRGREHPTSSTHRLGPLSIELELVLGHAAQAAQQARAVLDAEPPEPTRRRTLALLARAEPTAAAVAALPPGGLDRIWAEALLREDGAMLADAAKRHLEAGRALAAAELAARAAERFRCRGDDATARRLERVTSVALAGAELPRPSHWPGTGGAVLTQREREIADLVAAGIETQTLAERLHLSRRTVENHLQRCYRKLGVNNRRELAAALGGAPALRLA